MEELKPCPFCGGKAAVKTGSNGVGNSGTFSQFHSVFCSKCGATTERTYKTEFRRDLGVFKVIKDGYQEAISDWNRRATE